MSWENRRHICGPSQAIWWATTGLGPCWAEIVDCQTLRLLLVGRDSENRSRIGEGRLNLDTLQFQLNEDPVLGLGERGAFDFNGVSYPWIVKTPNSERLYYTGWTRGYHVPFINDLGVAERTEPEKQFKRYSRAPIFPRTNEEPFGTGSVCVLKNGGQWQMWYTSFVSWQKTPNDHRHYYHIRTATSSDGLAWTRLSEPCIDFDVRHGEYAIARPSVLHYRGKFLMWFSVRGASYHIEFACSKDGMTWKRFDDDLSLHRSHIGWDSEMVCYGHVILVNDVLVMLYTGNGYGRSGFGIATFPLDRLDQLLSHYCE